MEYPNLPYLIDGNNKITETKAIMVYIAKKWRPELLGTTAAQVGRIEMISYHVDKLKNNAINACYDPGNPAEIVKDSRDPLSKLFEIKGNSKWLCGNDLSWPDFYLVELLDMFA